MITVALLGNPNTGKSTLFSALAGVRQRTGNFPGVTVEKKIGHLQHGGQQFDLVDLPGTYSLAPRSLDEMVAVDMLLGRLADVAPPNVVLAIVDASNLDRNLYLVSQVRELGLPMVVALNMTDVARERGIEIDVAELSTRLRTPVVPLQANKRVGLDTLKTALAAAAESHHAQANCNRAADGTSPFAPEFQQEVQTLQTTVEAAIGKSTPRYLVERLLLDTSGYIEGSLLGEDHGEVRRQLGEARARLDAAGQTIPAVEAIARYGWIHSLLDGIVKRPTERRVTSSDKIDRVLTDKVWGTIFFAWLMLLVFSSIFIFAAPVMDLIDSGVGMVQGWITGDEETPGLLAEGPLQSLIADGIVGGVGGVVIFLPQILFLFFFIAVLEDCGYMARAAYLMDKLMVRAGLSGKSFIPLFSSFACAIPGIMATRVIENRRDRLTTILVAPLMSCSARLPVYTILIAAFIPSTGWLGGLIGLQGLVMFSMYLLGIVTAVIVALLLKKTLLKGETPPFVMELPSYKLPSFSMVFRRMFDAGWAFLVRAGTVILAVSIVIWALAYYPQNEQLVANGVNQRDAQLKGQVDVLPEGSPERAAAEERWQAFQDPAEREHYAQSLQQRNSYLGRMGRTIEPAVRPLGWDWRIGSAAIASFPAREVIMSVLGVIYSLGDVDVGDEADQERLMTKLQEARWDDSGEPVYNTAVALSIMVFFALCAQCAATLAVIRRETGSWRWPLFAFGYMTALAYFGAMITYQVAVRIPGLA